jgi:hypothetical protein
VSRYAPLLLFVLVSFGCVIITAPAFISAMYPIELEPREGTNWLHALALSGTIYLPSLGMPLVPTEKHPLRSRTVFAG